MSDDKKFEDELKRIVRRAMRLRAAIADSADIRRVRVDACRVAAHTRGAHTRLVITVRKDKK